MSFIHYIVHPEGQIDKLEGFISEIEARNRAKELAAKLPGIEIIVMSTLAVYRNVPRVEEQKLEHMPEDWPTTKIGGTGQSK